jgi:hypothetical protein
MLTKKEACCISKEMGDLIYKMCKKYCGFEICGSISGGRPITEDAWVFHARFVLDWKKPTRLSEEELEELFSGILEKIKLRLYTFAFGKYDDRWFIELTATQYRKSKRHNSSVFTSSKVYRNIKEEK